MPACRAQPLHSTDANTAQAEGIDKQANRNICRHEWTTSLASAQHWTLSACSSPLISVPLTPSLSPSMHLEAVLHGGHVVLVGRVVGVDELGHDGVVLTQAVGVHATMVGDIGHTPLHNE